MQSFVIFCKYSLIYITARNAKVRDKISAVLGVRVAYDSLSD